MVVDISSGPFKTTIRELWLPGAINGVNLPASKHNGHALTLTGAAKRTTADGVHFTGAATSNIVVAAAAGQNLQQAFAITIRFKLDATFAAGAAADQYLFTKRLDANNWIDVWLENLDGKLYWRQGDGVGGNQFTLTSTTVSWTAGVWYIITVSLTNTPTQRMIVNNVVEDTDVAAAVATPNGGDMIIGNSAAAGAIGLVGVISWVVIGVGTTAATALTAAEETDLSRGIAPATAKVQYLFTMDEGRGLTANDRGSAGGNGTIGAACTWTFGRVRQPCLSLDGINDYASSGVFGNPSLSPQTIIWVGKMKSTYSSLAIGDVRFFRFHQDANNMFTLVYSSGVNRIRAQAFSQGVTNSVVDYAYTPSIDDYVVFILTLLADNMLTFYHNGSSVGVSAGGGLPIQLINPQMFVGRSSAAIEYDVSKPLLIGLFGQVFSARQALEYSRFLDKIFNLGIGI